MPALLSKTVAPLLLFTVSVIVSIDTASAAAERPNIVIVLADDMGYSDLGCYGGEIETPRLDELAAGGLRFTQFYNTARCCPTRAALLTGLYQHRAGIGHMVGNAGVPSYQGFLNDRCLTIAEALRPAGYTTLATGKWHVGSQPGRWPLDRGFDRYYGSPSGGGFYFEGSYRYRKSLLTLGNDRVEFPPGGYTTDLFTDYAIRFVEEAVDDGKPFFLYLAHIAPHWPLQAKPDDIAKYAGRYDAGWDVIRAARHRKQLELGVVDEQWPLSPQHPGAQPWKQLDAEKRRDLSHRMSVYAAQVDCIDQNVGRLVDTLTKRDVFDDTLFLFLSDNGCSAEGGPGGFRRGDKQAAIGTGETYASVGLEWANVSDTPFRRFKMNAHEGGIATPLIAHWPNGIARRNDFERQPGHVIDLLPTCLDVAGAAYPKRRNGKPTIPPAGTSLVPAFGGESLGERDLFWEHEGNRGVRRGDWKLVADHRGAWELYDLAKDRTETRNVAARHPQRVNELKTAWQTWAKRNGVLPWPVKKKKPKK